MVTLLAFGAFMIIQGSFGQEYINTRCEMMEKGDTSGMYSFEEAMFNEVKKMEDILAGAANNNFCTEQCKCFKSQEAYKVYGGYSEETLNRFGRTHILTNEPGYNPKYKPMVWSEVSKTSFSNLVECLDFWEAHKDTPGFE